MRKSWYFILMLFVAGCVKDQMVTQSTPASQNYAGDFNYTVKMEKITGLPQDKPGMNVQGFLSAIRVDKSDNNRLWVSSLHGLDQCFSATIQGDVFVLDKTMTTLTLEDLGFKNVDISGPDQYVSITGTGKPKGVITYSLEMNDEILFKCTCTPSPLSQGGYQANNYLKVCE
jgi:hypothetical protein